MVQVVKQNGDKEPFSEEKLTLSIKRAGIPDSISSEAISRIKESLYENIPTSEIYRHVTEFLAHSSQPYSRTKYSLKQAIMDFGPTGFPFEDYVAEILKSEGYETKVRQILPGNCINHEIDVVAQKDSSKFMVECKFHSNSGTKCHIHVCLYTKARFDDIKDKNNLSEAWLVTNTKVTSDFLTFAKCNNMKVISWDYPPGETLRDLIEKHKLHPITVLTNITSSEKTTLMNNHIVLSRDICKNPSSLDILNLPSDKKNSIVTECQYVYG